MSESKIELNARKIRNGARKELEARQKKLWDTLSTEYTPPPFTVRFIMEPYDKKIYTKSVTPVTHNAKKSWEYHDCKGDTFDSVFIDEFGKEDE